MSQVLEKARTYEKEQAKKIVGDMRPAFHLTPYVGWMNDPNGCHFTRESIICFINIIHIAANGDQCIGGMQ